MGNSGFLPALVGPLIGKPGGEQNKPFMLQTKGYDHPITALWNDPTLGTLGTIHVYAYYPLTLPPWKPPAKGEETPTGGEPHAILHLAEGDVLAAEHTWGLGRVIMFGSSPTTVWNDFPVHQPFVPFMHRILGSIVQRQDEGLNLRVGQKFSYTVSSNVLNKDVSVTIPGDEQKPKIVGQVILKNGVPTVFYNDTDVAGSYLVSIASDPPTLLHFAAQADPTESDLTPLSNSQLITLGEAAEVLKWSPEMQLGVKLKTDRTGTEIWMPLLVLALMIAVVETFLAQRYSQPK